MLKTIRPTVVTLAQLKLSCLSHPMVLFAVSLFKSYAFDCYELCMAVNAERIATARYEKVEDFAVSFILLTDG